MSRVSRRSGTKSLSCYRCQSMYGNKNGKIVLSFRGKSQARLDKHLKEIHNVG